MKKLRRPSRHPWVYALESTHFPLIRAERKHHKVGLKLIQAGR